MVRIYILGSRINSEQHIFDSRPKPFRKIIGVDDSEPSHVNRRERALSDVAPRTYTTRSVPADFVARLTAVACSLLTPRWRWALALCRNAIQPGHAEQRAVGPRWPEEPHATQRDLHHAPPAQSQASATRRMVARLSPTRSRSSNLARRASLLGK